MNLFQIKERLGEAGALITFSGQFSHSIIEELGVAVKAYLQSDAVQKSAMQDVFSVYIEAAQNLQNYARILPSSSILVIAKQGERYEVHAGNEVTPADGDRLASRIQELAGLDKAALKALYKERLRAERPQGATSTGLGLIEMARRASEPLSCELKPLNAERSFFSLKVVI